MVHDRGVDDSIHRIKTMKLSATRYICGQPLKTSGNPSVSLNSKGLARELQCLQDLVVGTVNEKRLLLTLLSVSRALPGSPYVPPLDTISRKPKIEQKMKTELDMLIPMIMNSLGLNTSKPKWSKFHLTTKAGPNAIALKSAMIDCHLLPDDLYKDILIIGGDGIKKVIDALKDFDFMETLAMHKIRKPVEKLVIRKLSIVNAPERKSRIIAILDYWSQTALKPLHDRIFSILKGLEGDCTFRQTKPQKYLVEGPYYSLDLTSATDRFPVEIQEIVVRELTQSPEYAAAWRRVLTAHPFYVPWEGSFIKYETGQPMGAYSSWAVFALTHHIIVRIAGMMVGKPSFTNYALLGDDIVIGGDDVARKYLEIIKSLGVDISMTKSHVSDDTYEFAKRWYYKGVEITGAQIHAFTSVKK